MESMQVGPINRTAFLDQVVEGCILGDATLRRTSASAFFRLGQCLERRDFVIEVKDILSKHGVLAKLDPYADGRLDVRTPADLYWKEFRDRFYPEGIKVIPKDYWPSRISLLFFYLCDGYFMCKDNYRRYYGSGSGITELSEWCYLATYDFTLEDVEAFKAKVAGVLGVNGVVYPQRQNDKVYPRLVFRGLECHKFLDSIYLQEYVPESMKAKFRVKEIT